MPAPYVPRKQREYKVHQLEKYVDEDLKVSHPKLQFRLVYP